MTEEKERAGARITRQKVLVTKLTEELKGFENIDQNLSDHNQKIYDLEQQREELRQQLAKNEGNIVSITTKGKETRSKKEKIEDLIDLQSDSQLAQRLRGLGYLD